MATFFAALFFTLRVIALITGRNNKWLLSSLALSLASFCLDYFREADSAAMQRVWAIAENRWK